MLFFPWERVKKAIRVKLASENLLIVGEMSNFP